MRRHLGFHSKTRHQPGFDAEIWFFGDEAECDYEDEIPISVQEAVFVLTYGW